MLNGRQRAVYVLDATNRVHIRNVQVGVEGSKLAEITTGISPGDRVIVGGQEKYQAGETVNPLVTPEPVSETVQESGGTIDMKAEENAGDNH